MIQHGGQYQFSDHTNDTVTFFGPKGERVHVTGQKALREFYGENFPGRLPPPADPHGVPSCPVERGFERTGPTHIVVEGQDAPPARPIGRGHGKLEPPPPRQAPNPEVSNVVPFRRK